MGRKRSKLAIIESILSSIRDSRGKIKQTRLMYKANLSHTQMKIYLKELMNKKLIKEIDEEPYIYLVLTEKGFKFLEDLQKMREFEKAFGI